MKSTFPLLSLAIATLQCSCSAVLTENHIADQTEDLLQEKLEGTWQHEDGVFQIEFDASNTGWGAGVEWEDDTFQLSQARIQAKKFGDEYIMTAEPIVKDSDDKPRGNFLIRFSFPESGELHFFPPDVEAFESLVEDETLNGRIEKGKFTSQVLLDDIRAEIPKLDNLEELFPESEDKLLLRRLPSFETP